MMHSLKRLPVISCKLYGCGFPLHCSQILLVIYAEHILPLSVIKTTNGGRNVSFMSALLPLLKLDRGRITAWRHLIHRSEVMDITARPVPRPAPGAGAVLSAYIGKTGKLWRKHAGK